MVTRTQFGKEYKLVASTEKRLGIVLMAISQVDKVLATAKRPRINKKKKKIRKTTNPEYFGFEDSLVREINLFKQKRKLVL